MSVEWFVASRYLRARGRSRFRSLISLLAVGGVVVGVASAIVVLGVMNGFSKEVRGRIVGTNAHVVLLDPEERGIESPEVVVSAVEEVEGVVAAVPFVYGKVMISTAREAEGAVLRGMDRAAESLVTEVPGSIFPENAELGRRAETDLDELPGIVLGVGLAASLRAGIGETVSVMVPTVRRRGIPRMRSFVVTGLFESGMHEYDSALALTSIESAAEALDSAGRATGILVRVTDMDDAPAIGERIVSEIADPPLWANDWIRQNRQLFLWMRIEKIVGYLLFGVILVVASFLIASTLIMIVLEKTREIGVLMAVGMARRSIRRLFVLEGAAIGGTGTVLGCLTGWLACAGLDRYRLTLPGDVYFIETLPVELWWGDLVIVAMLAFAVSVLSALYPSWRASRLVPAEAIRYE
ncbi:MAG: ABC transporter permease [Gemmatimonadota bacterium]|jgi:lipoprotein-releasing system permease protein|nr:lipoprotein-releasing system transmembrane subunit LolC [Candidatus Woesearchaeota archaeon]MDP6461940.1 ABC transporter permease [Gemmatimonadota bacterium]MDP6530169.1 ABC transporter permease [Gemmatimonadota bacterium]MDP6802062.1 ABC transporter permease [Gemmatimonadota bacterium]MDP7032442.1 ABC transporter permease [Gemmatimonadota bacterium]